MLFNEGQYDSVKKHLLTIIEQKPNPMYLHALILLGLIENKKGEFEKAIKYYDRAYRVDHTCTEDMFFKSIDYLNLNKPDESFKAIKDAINQHLKLKKLWFLDLGNDITQIKIFDNEIFSK
jgi:tetratricopeptide (TPR) repeat protein